jgi:predicted phage terminase large subunit-like protein
MALRPQEGPQTDFLSTNADIAIYGGGAGGGKTFALIMETLRHMYSETFSTVIFRKTYREIMNPGGLWDEANFVYRHLPEVERPSMKQTSMQADFPSGAVVKFAHLQHEKNKYDWQGSQIGLIGFDELTHFTKSQFFYLLSRARDAKSDVEPYIRGTTNPDAASWVKDFIGPWVSTRWREMEIKAAKAEGRCPLLPSSGDILYVKTEGDGYQYLRPEEYAALDQEQQEEYKSLTFIRSLVTDNKILMEKDPSYIRNLKLLPTVERERLLNGDWDIEEGDMLFQRGWFDVVRIENLPIEHLGPPVRYWDLASTDRKEAEKNPKACYTAGVLMAQDTKTKVLYILDVRRVQYNPGKLRDLIVDTAHWDRERWGDSLGNTRVYMEQEPGASGKDVIDAYSRELVGFVFEGDLPSGSKKVRTEPVASAAERGLVKLVAAPWNEAFLQEMSTYPIGLKDQADAMAGAYMKLTGRRKFVFV